MQFVIDRVLMREDRELKRLVIAEANARITRAAQAAPDSPHAKFVESTEFDNLIEAVAEGRLRKAVILEGPEDHAGIGA